ncbi:MAG: CoA transferase, partial [Deltaproteobacteria bacterium]|nr:CoA transferase [Deltaproteobacteria bacterium]
MSAGFLEGYRALDLTGWGGQLCGRILADLGMEVIKIEPPGGDPVRRLPPIIK